ncbi:MAG TPA: hypothetical protein VF239_07295 [Vicinamibacterales bacterium]
MSTQLGACVTDLFASLDGAAHHFHAVGANGVAKLAREIHLSAIINRQHCHARVHLDRCERAGAAVGLRNAIFSYRDELVPELFYALVDYPRTMLPRHYSRRGVCDRRT